MGLLRPGNRAFTFLGIFSRLKCQIRRHFFNEAVLLSKSINEDKVVIFDPDRDKCLLVHQHDDKEPINSLHNITSNT